MWGWVLLLIWKPPGACMPINIPFTWELSGSPASWTLCYHPWGPVSMPGLGTKILQTTQCSPRKKKEKTRKEKKEKNRKRTGKQNPREIAKKNSKQMAATSIQHTQTQKKGKENKQTKKTTTKDKKRKKKNNKKPSEQTSKRILIWQQSIRTKLTK